MKREIERKTLTTVLVLCIQAENDWEVTTRKSFSDFSGVLEVSLIQNEFIRRKSLQRQNRRPRTEVGAVLTATDGLIREITGDAGYH